MLVPVPNTMNEFIQYMEAHNLVWDSIAWRWGVSTFMAKQYVCYRIMWKKDKNEALRMFYGEKILIRAYNKIIEEAMRKVPGNDWSGNDHCGYDFWDNIVFYKQDHS